MCNGDQHETLTMALAARHMLEQEITELDVAKLKIAMLIAGLHELKEKLRECNQTNAYLKDKLKNHANKRNKERS